MIKKFLANLSGIISGRRRLEEAMALSERSRLEREAKEQAERLRLIGSPEAISALQALAEGYTCDEEALTSNVLIITNQRECRYKAVPIDTFRALRDKGLIEIKGTNHNFHPIFRPSHNNPVNEYVISLQGGAYLAGKAKPDVSAEPAQKAE